MFHPTPKNLCFRWHHFLPSAEQRATLVNIKLKWTKDRHLDSIVSRDRHLPQLHRLLSLISSAPRGVIPSQQLPARPLNLGNNRRLLPSQFLLRFPSLVRASPSPPSFHLTDTALHLRNLELVILHSIEPQLVNSLRRLLMLSANSCLPLEIVDQLSWDMGFPANYREKILLCYPDLFRVFRPENDECVWVKLSCWDPLLAVSELQRGGADKGDDGLAFPVSFTRGFALRRKCMMWLREWQRLPYTSPYDDPSGLDPRTDVSEKRIVGVFHELLSLTLSKKTERGNFSNLRKPLRLPQKFTKVFERHPGIFYLSKKLGVQTVVLREAYGGGRELVRKHPLVGVRERYAALMNVGRSEIGGRVCVPQESEECCSS